MRVAIIGAGPSGLVTLKYLIEAHKFLGEVDPIEARLFEAEDSIGGTFSHRTYEDAELVSSKQLTTFSDFRPRPEDPDFLTATRYIEYLHDYCTHFGLWPHINLSTPVVSVRRRRRTTIGGKGETLTHEVTYQRSGGEPQVWECDSVAVCSGLHVTPNIPDLPGAERVPNVLHSSAFKARAQFGSGTTVLVLGSGETGMDLAHLAVTSPTARVVLSHRDGFLCAPKRVPDPVILPVLGFGPDPSRLNVPVDSSSASLFDTAYVHPILRDHMALWEYYDFFIKSTLWLVSGTMHGLDEWVGGISKERYHASKIFFNKSNKAMPYISAPYRGAGKKSLIERVRSNLIQVPIADTGGRQIDLAPWPDFVDEAGVVHFRDNGRPEAERMRDQKIRPDVLVYATGYTQTFPFFDAQNRSGSEEAGDEAGSYLSSSSYRYPTAAEADVREIWRRDEPTVGFIGFIRPSFGAIPPLAEMQAQLWILQLAGAPGRIPGSPLRPTDEPHYRLLTPPAARIGYGVDHESYAYQLALDMGSAPSAGEILRLGWRGGGGGGGRSWYRLPLVWALGANFNAKFRLRGPWRWDGAEEVLCGELWDTVERRGGFFGLVTLSGIPIMIFGTISLLCYIYAGIVDSVGQIRKRVFPW